MYLLLLGDTHFTGDQKDIYLFEKLGNITSAVKSRIKKASKLLIIVNGDIANTGKQKEYVSARSFFHQLDEEILKNTLVSSIEYIFNPGNHDCDISVYSSNKKRADLYQELTIEKIEKEYMEYSKKLKNYQKFITFFNIPKMEFENKYFKYFFVENEDYTFLFKAFNSVLSYDPEYRITNMLIDSDQIEFNIYDQSNTINFTLSHFPIEFFDRQKKGNYEQITKNSHVVMFSHEHYSSTITHKSENKDYIEIKLPALNATNQVALSGFMISELIVENQLFRVDSFRYNGNLYICENSEEYVIATNKIIVSKDFSYSKKLYDFLGNKFQENHENAIDCFVHPTFVRQVYKDDNSYENEFIEYLDFNIESEDELTILVGTQFIGKTTILKSFILRYLELGYIPIYVHANYKKNTENKIERQIESFINEYYFGCNDFIDQNPEKVLILFDNLHLLKGETESILDFLLSKYRRVLATADTKSYIPDFLANVEYNISYFDIMHFGNNQKYQLVENWVKNKEFNDEMIESQRINEIMSIIQRVDRERNFMTTPKLVIIFLEAYDDKKTDKLLKGSKGIYYQYLIDKLLIDIAEETKVETSFIESYLMEYAHSLFESDDDFSVKDFNKMFLENYPISEKDYYNNVKCLEEKFKKSDAFYYDDENPILFTNEIVYSYFVAAYYQKLGVLKKEEIYKLIVDIDDNSNANIVLFYFFLTKDPNVVSQITELASSLFKELEEVRLEDDVDFINDIITGVKDVEDAKNIKGKYQELSRKVDQHDYNNKYKKPSQDISDSDENEFIINRHRSLVKALKINDLISEILNQFPGKKQFNSLIQANVNLSLRKSTDLIMYTYAYLTFLSSLDEDYFTQNEEIFKKRLNRLLNTLVFIFIELAENLKIKRYQESIFQVFDNLPSTIAMDVLKSIEKVYFLRGEPKTNYDFLVKLKNRLVKEKNSLAVGMLHTVVHREVNYIGMEPSPKYKLLEQLNAKKLQRSSKDPVKKMNFANESKKERLDMLKNKQK